MVADPIGRPHTRAPRSGRNPCGTVIDISAKSSCEHVSDRATRHTGFEDDDGLVAGAIFLVAVPLVDGGSQSVEVAPDEWSVPAKVATAIKRRVRICL